MMVRAELIEKSIGIVLMLLLGHPFVLGWRSFKIIFNGIEFEANEKLVDVKIELKNTSSKRVVNSVFNIRQDLDDVELFASLALEAQTGNYTTLVSRNMNLCKILRDGAADSFTWALYQDLARHGKLFRQCPLQKGTYSLQNYTVDEELLPSFLPEVDFKFFLRLARPEGEQIFKGTFSGRIDKSKGFNNLKMFSLG